MGQDCKYCGAYISGGEDRCPACGKKIKGAAASYGAAAAAAQEEAREERREDKSTENNYTYNYTYTYKDEYDRRYGERNSRGETDGNRTYRPGQSGAVYSSGDDDVSRNRALCYLCYFGPLFLIPYLLKRDSEFVRFHSNQGLLLLLANVIVNILGEMFILGGLIRFIGGIFIFVCFIKGLVNVSRGQKTPLPVIGEIKILK